MAERKIIKAIEIIKDFFIFNNLNLNKLILFGSNSAGRNSKESDIDLIVISDDFRNKNLFAKAEMMGNLEWELVKKTNTPFDILYYSTDQWKNSDSLIITEAKEKGKIVFEKNK